VIGRLTCLGVGIFS